MRSLSAEDVLRIWEIGQAQHPLDRALTLLSFALPDKSAEELTHFTIGQRDAYLLTLREITLGTQLNSFATCPQCGENLEFSLQVSDLRVTQELEMKPEMNPDQMQPDHQNHPDHNHHDHTIVIDGFQIEFRLPNSLDLAAVVSYRDIPAAAHALTQQCLRSVRQGERLVEIPQVPSAILAQLSQHMAERDPQAETLLDLTCPNCGHRWQLLFDIVSFFWTELSVQAKRLLREVHLLAQSYGWQERDILMMHPIRRQFYLELLT